MPEVFIHGKPAGQGNLRRSAGGGLYNPDKATAPWKGSIAAVVGAELDGAGVTREPVALLCRFYFTRPAGHFKKSGGLSSTARRTPTVAPDVDKLVRAVLDALTGVLYHDDAQVIQLHAFKAYASEAGLRLTWDTLTPVTAAGDLADAGELVPGA
jgi:crossover junction endodeoxyribonuclease RusA